MTDEYRAGVEACLALVCRRIDNRRQINYPTGDLELTRNEIEALLEGDPEAESLTMLHRAYKGLIGSKKQGATFLMADIERMLQSHGIDPMGPVRAEVPGGGGTSGA